MASVTSRQFNHDLGAAKRAAETEPVVITDRGEPAFVLMSIAEYRRIAGRTESIASQLRAKNDLDFTPARLVIEFQVPEL